MHAFAEIDSVPKRLVLRRQDIDGDLDPIELLAGAPASDVVFYLERPDAGEAVVAIGSAAEVRTEGATRFEQASAAAATLLSSLTIEGPASSAACPPVLPRLVGGFSFADTVGSELWRDFASCHFVLPRTQWILAEARWVRFDVVGAERPLATSRQPTARRGAIAFTESALEAASTVGDESPHEWLARASTVLDAIEKGRFDKIVVARRESRSLPKDVDVARVLADLRAARPACYTFCFASGSSTFLGSSPEKLVGVRDGAVEADALAGTIARGRTTAEDLALAGTLAASEKDLREHALVVDALRTTLAPLVHDLEPDARPTTRAFPEGHHLHTSVRARRVDGVSVLDLVAAVHPTPAVCGVPRAKAQELVGRLESDRGWYSGGIGWLDAAGEGLFAVALRAGLLAGGRLTTWAGAGIVAGSDVALELDETTLKMRALLDVVGEQAA